MPTAAAGVRRASAATTTAFAGIRVRPPSGVGDLHPGRAAAGEQDPADNGAGRSSNAVVPAGGQRAEHGVGPGPARCRAWARGAGQRHGLHLAAGRPAVVEGRGQPGQGRPRPGRRVEPSVVTRSSRAASASRSCHSVSLMKAMRSLPYGEGQAQVQCAPMPPTLVDSEASGMSSWSGVPGDRRRTRWVPGRGGVLGAVVRVGGDVWSFGGQLIPGSCGGVSLVPDVGPGNAGQRGAGFEHEDTQTAGPVRPESVRRRSRPARCRR